MKKLILSLCILITCFNAISQSVIQRTPGTNTVNDPRQMHTLNLFIPRYLDTTNANQSGSIGIDSCGALIFTYTGNLIWTRGCSPKRWIPIGTGIPSLLSDTLFAQLPLFFDSLTRAPSTIIKFLQGNGIVSGGTITVDSCRTIDVLPTVIVLNYVQYSSPATVLTVPVSDPTFPRTDEIIDSLGYIILRVGTPSATPVGKPYNSSTEVVLGSYTIQAGASCIDINQIIVWDENVGTTVEFNFTTFGTISANGDDIANPKHLTKDIFVNTYTNGSSLIFTYSSPLTAQAGEIFKFWVYLNGTFGTNQFQIQYFLGSTPVGSPISFGSGFGFNPNDSNFYQQVNVPLSANNLINQTFDKIVITFSGEDISGAKGLYLDYLQLQTGATNIGSGLGVIFYGLNATSDSTQLIREDGRIFTAPLGGGGGSVTANNGLTVNTGSNVQLGGTLLQNTTVDLNGHQILLGNNLEIHSAVDNEFAMLGVINETGVTKGSDIAAHSDADGSDIYLESVYDNGAKSGLIELHTDATTSTAEYTADSHEFTGTLEFNTVASGATTDSVLTVDPVTKIVTWRNAASFGGQQNLQQVTDVGDTTTHTIIAQGISSPNASYVLVNAGGVGGFLSLANISDFATTLTVQAASLGEQIKMPWTGNPFDTLATLSDIRAGGSQNLQQVTSVGNTTSNVMYSTDSIKAYSMYSSGGDMLGDSSALSPADTTVSYGASPELGAFVATGYPVTVGSNLNTFPLVKAISGTSFQKISTGDSSMVDRIYTIPVYRSTERDLFIGGGSFLNDYQFAIGTGGLAAAINKVIDTAHIARGWPLNRIVLVSPSIFGTHLYPAVVGASKTNDSLRIYSNVAIAAAKAKGILYVDAFTYMSNNGGATLVQADSIHPTQTGQYEISEAVTYRISDVKVNNSLRVQRDFLAKGTGFFGSKVTFADSSAATFGNFRGRINWGVWPSVSMNAITTYNGGTTSLVSGIGITSSSQIVFMARGATTGLFTVGQDATTATTSNANFYISPATTPTPLTASLSTVFNGDTWFFNAKPTTLTFAAVSGGTNNVVNTINFGNVTSTQGIKTLDAGSTSLTAGLVYKSTGNSYLIGRGSFSLFMGNGLDETNMSASNAAAYINPLNKLFVNGLATAIVAKTGAYTATPLDGTINYTSGTVTCSLPSAIPITGTEYTIKNSGAGAITVQGNPNGVATVTPITGGSGYVNGTYNNVGLTGGTGTVAQATIVVAGGAVTTVTITQAGRDYTVADVLSALTASIGGGAGSGFSVPVATLVSQTIDGSNTYSLPTQYKYVKIQSNGANWIVVANN